MATVNTTGSTISTANPGRDGTGTIVTGWTAGASGGYVRTIRIKATGNTDAGMVRIFHYDGAYYLWREIQVVAITPDRTTPSFESELNFVNDNSTGWQVGAADTIRFATEQAQEFDIIVEGMDN